MTTNKELFASLDKEYYNNLISSILTRSNSILNYDWNSPIEKRHDENVNTPHHPRIYLYNLVFPFNIHWDTEWKHGKGIVKYDISSAKTMLLIILMYIFGYINPKIPSAVKVFECMYNRIYTQPPEQKYIDKFRNLITSSGYGYGNITSPLVYIAYNRRKLFEEKSMHVSQHGGACELCGGEFDDDRYRRAECGKCHYVLCGDCLMRYTLNRTTDVLCPNPNGKCNELYNEMFILDVFGKRYNDIYETHRKVILWDENLSEFNEFGLYIPLEMKRRKIAMKIVIVCILSFIGNRRNIQELRSDYSRYRIDDTLYDSTKKYLINNGIHKLDKDVFRKLCELFVKCNPDKLYDQFNYFFIQIVSHLCILHIQI